MKSFAKFEYIDGAAELYRAYNMQSCRSRRYIKKGETVITLDVFDMGRTEDAFGVFTHDTDGERIDIGQDARYRPGWLSFWQHRFYVSICLEEECAAAEKAVKALGKRVASASFDGAQLPILIVRGGVMVSRNLGQSGISVSALGLGCMGLSEFYGEPTPASEAIDLLHRAVDLGITHFDTAEIYGQGRNEQLLGKAFAGRWDQIVLATKFGPQRDPVTGAFVGVDGSPANVRDSCEKSLKRLGIEAIDLYYLHRVDPDTPIEDTVGEMAKLVQEGKIRAVGLSEASARTIERAHAVHPIAALQTEYSLFSRDVEKDIGPTCEALGIGLVAYSPLGRGILTGRYTATSDRPTSETDFRTRMQPRFQPGNIEPNLKLVAAIKAMAARKECVAAQVALAWVLDHGDHVVAIPGTTKLANLQTNLGALACRLTEEDRATLDELADQVRGDRYAPEGMAAINQ